MRVEALDAVPWDIDEVNFDEGLRVAVGVLYSQHVIEFDMVRLSPDVAQPDLVLGVSVAAVMV